MKKVKSISSKALKILVLVMIAILAWIAFLAYRMLYSPDFTGKETTYIYIDKNTSFDQLCITLADTAQCKRMKSFIFLAEKLSYPENMKTGRYAVAPGMTHLALLNRLRRGQQSAIRITFNNVRQLDELAESLDEQLMLDKGEITEKLSDPDFCIRQGFSSSTIPAMFIPNTYEVFWNISAENLLSRMKREYDTFWNSERKEKAQAADLDPIDISILASIVEEESAVEDEYPVIAGLYINRLKKGMLLQADPTIKYSLGDFTLRRILDKHKAADSPYNTYKHTGLPPGPIRIPSIKAIDGTLDYMKHKYLYMCAKEDFSGRHNFAVTLSEHTRNASRYHAELNRRRIR